MKKFKNSLALLSLVLVGIVSIAAVKFAPTIWTIDKNHSAVKFSVRHFFTPVNGNFTEYEADIAFSADDLKNSSINVTIPISSINTSNDDRDAHLRTPDFFNAEKFPTMSFKSDKIVAAGENEFIAHGKLTIKDVTKNIELPFKLLGVMPHPNSGKLIAGITSKFTLNRNDYGVGTGDYIATAVIGNEITIELNLELNEKK
ncbi:MAG: YceI family protein [Balneolaceae bacterium]